MADIQPRDRPFRGVFANLLGVIAALCRHALPDIICDDLDWPTLTLVSGSYVDKDMEDVQRDLLCQVQHAGGGESILLYLLFDQQPTSDPLLRLRLFGYCCSIWEADQRNEPTPSKLRPIVPVVFYLGSGGWSHSTKFADLFAEDARALPWTPKFTHGLIARAPDLPNAKPLESGTPDRDSIIQSLVDVVENHLMQMELTWDTIEAATGLSEAEFQDFKTGLSGSGPQSAC